MFSNAVLLYGYVRSEENKPLFAALEANEDLVFSEQHQDAQEKYSVQLVSLGYDTDVDCISACYGSCCERNGTAHTVLTQTTFEQYETYQESLRAFFTAICLDADAYAPAWHLLGYND